MVDEMPCSNWTKGWWRESRRTRVSGRKAKRASSASLALLVAGATALLASCQFAAAFWVVSGSTAEHLVFGFSETREDDVAVGLGAFTLYRCADIRRRYDREGVYVGSYPPPDEAVWSIRSSPTERPKRNRLRYGEVPTGMVEHVAAEALEKPGCYVATLYIENTWGNIQQATGGFRMAEDGTVAELTRNEHRRIFSASQ